MIETDPRRATPTHTEGAQGDPATLALDGLLLPERAVLLHVGPHKTGTTSIQSALHLARPALARQGVIYAGPRRHSGFAVQAVRGVAPSPNHERGVREWRGLIDEARHARDARVVLSSEWFSEATPQAIPRIVEDLGAERVHVLMTLRPLGAILPSQWQQYVQGGMRTPYEEWLAGILNRSDRAVTPSFWQRHRHDDLVSRWAHVVGNRRVTVVIANDRDHRVVLRALEAMLGLTADTLLVHDDRSNRSMTWPEIEVVRHIHKMLDEAGVPGLLRQDLLLSGAAPAMRERQPAAGEPRIETPRWALERAAEIGAEIAAGIAASGVRVVGDLDRLAAVPADGPQDLAAPPEVWPEIAAAAVVGILHRIGLVSSPASSDSRGSPVTQMPTRQLLGILARRLQRAATRRLRRIGSSGRRVTRQDM